MRKLLKNIEQFLCGWIGRWWIGDECIDCGMKKPDYYFKTPE